MQFFLSIFFMLKQLWCLLSKVNNKQTLCFYKVYNGTFKLCLDERHLIVNSIEAMKLSVIAHPIGSKFLLNPPQSSQFLSITMYQKLWLKILCYMDSRTHTQHGCVFKYLTKLWKNTPFSSIIKCPRVTPMS